MTASWKSVLFWARCNLSFKILLYVTFSFPFQRNTLLLKHLACGGLLLGRCYSMSNVQYGTAHRRNNVDIKKLKITIYACIFGLSFLPIRIFIFVLNQDSRHIRNIAAHYFTKMRTDRCSSSRPEIITNNT